MSGAGQPDNAYSKTLSNRSDVAKFDRLKGSMLFCGWDSQFFTEVGS